MTPLQKIITASITFIAKFKEVKYRVSKEWMLEEWNVSVGPK